MIPKLASFSLTKVLLAALATTGTLTVSASASPIKVLGQTVQDVPSANPVAVSDSIISAGFSFALQQQGQDLLENPSGSILRFGYLSDAVTRTEPDENTYLILDHNPGGPTPNYD